MFAPWIYAVSFDSPKVFPDMKTVVVLNSDQMGHGDSDLGIKILGTFLTKSPVMRDLQAIVLYNSGVKLIVEGSPVLPQLHNLREAGVDLLPCGTCLIHFGLTPAIGQASDMNEIIRELDRAEKVITL